MLTVIYGCTDENAVNYNSNASEDNGSCEYDGLSDCEYTELVVSMSGNGEGWFGNYLMVGDEAVTSQTCLM